MGVVLVDNDIVIKLAQCGLLKTFELWAKDAGQIQVLPALPFVARRRLEDSSQEAICSVEAFYAGDCVVDLPAVKEHHSELDSLDFGERQLVETILANVEVARFISGDKRALKQIAKLDKDLPRLVKRLEKVQVDCLESLLLRFIQSYGFEQIKSLICSNHDLKAADKVLASAFGLGRGQSHTFDALYSHLRDLRGQAPFVAPDL